MRTHAPRLTIAVFGFAFVVGFAFGCVGAPPVPCTDCGSGTCVDVQVDAQNCGACGNACAAGQVCKAGSCQTSCQANRTLCGTACVDLKSDSTNCGACGMACPSGERCEMGTCTLTCSPGLSVCDFACVDQKSDRANCGACGMACPSGQVCSAGTCTTSCGAGLTDCNGDCVDLQSSPAHCGACTTSCGGAHVNSNFCRAGVCSYDTCRAGFSDCDGVGTNGCELDNSGDVLNCGGCAQVCRPQHTLTALTCATLADGGLEPGTAFGDAGLVALTDGGLCALPAPVVDGGLDAGAVDAGTTDGGASCAADAGLPDGGCDHSHEPTVGALCRASVCGYQRCAPGYGDCDGVTANGCEAALINGLCPSVQRSWIFPGGVEPAYGAPRKMNFTIDAEAPATIYYTLDGSEPTPGNATTTSGPSPLTIANRDTSQIRWYAVFADGKREETQVQNFTVTPASSASLGIIVEGGHFGAAGGPVAVATPGQMLTFTGTEQDWRSDSTGYCPSCIVQYVWGVDTVGQIGCVPSAPTWPGSTQPRSRSFNAPMTPGRYYVRIANDLQFGCPTGSAGSLAIGVVVVR